MKFFLTLGLCLTSSFWLLSQESKPTFETLNQYYNSFILKGIKTELFQLENLSLRDLQLIDSYNFDSYRNEKTIREIQLEKGPLIKLESIDGMKAKNISVETNLKNHKANEISNGQNNSLVTLLNIGLGYSLVHLNNPENN